MPPPRGLSLSSVTSLGSESERQFVSSARELTGPSERKRDANHLSGPRPVPSASALRLIVQRAFASPGTLRAAKV
jgi:hypothetical protein